MSHGGARKGAGRKPGRPNGFTKERQQRVDASAAAIAAAVPGAFEGDAHALLMSVYKDPNHEIALRVDAAKAAIKFEKPALSSVEANVKTTLEMLDDDALDARIAAAAQAAGLAATH